MRKELPILTYDTRPAESAASSSSRIAPLRLEPTALLTSLIIKTLDDRKAEAIESIDLVGKSDFADRMVVATGTSMRHVHALADHLIDVLKRAGVNPLRFEGKDSSEWVLVDAGNVIVHLFTQAAREHYQIEKMWSV